MKRITIGKNKKISIEEVRLVAQNKAEVVVAKDVLERIQENFDAVKNLTGQNVYGLTTGVADLSIQKPSVSTDTLQKNILLSHAVGVGENLPKETVRAAIFSRLITLSQGYSGVSEDLLLFLTALLNKDIVPLVASLGSIGASDLTILAGIFVCMCNKGKVIYKNRVLSPFDAFKKAGIKYPKELQTREGLALINGNNAAIGLSCLLVDEIENFLTKSLQVAALSLEARGGTFSVYNQINQLLKPFPGQQKAAIILEKFLKRSKQIVTNYENEKNKFLQDPPSFKTIAQVFGNAFDSLELAKRTILVELNSPSDNPLIITKNVKTEVASSGNYLCVQLATTADQLSLVLESLAASSVARMKILLNDEYNEGLPLYLIADSQNNSGFMICAYAAESILSEIKALLYPRSNFDIAVANNWEDVSTNAWNAMLNMQKVLRLAHYIELFELTLSLQAMALRKQNNKKTLFGVQTEKIFEKYQILLGQIHLPVTNDQSVYDFIQKIQKEIFL